MNEPYRSGLHDEEKYILDVIRAARTIQEFLWADMNDESGLEEFRRMFRKRVAKIEAVSMDNPHWRVELNKRLLQTAAICVNLMAKTADGRLTFDGIHPSLPSNLPQFDQPVVDSALKIKLEKISYALDDHLGDTDPEFPEDITDDDIRREEPVFWAAKEINGLIQEFFSDSH